MRLLVLSFLALWISASGASEVRLRLTQKATHGNTIQAFPAADSCLNWYYLPSYFSAQVTSVTTGISQTKIENVPYTALLTNFSLSATPAYTEADIQGLRVAIAQKLKDVEKCSQLNAKPEQIVLTPADVRLGGAHGLQGEFFSKAAIGGRGGKTKYDLSLPLAGRFVLDASDPGTNDVISQMSDAGGPVMTAVFLVDGILAEGNSTLEVKGDLTTEFKAALVETNCHKDDDHGMFTDKKRTQCDFKRFSDLMSANFKNLFEFNHGNTKLFQEGDPIMVVFNKTDGEPVRMTLQSFLQAQLILAFARTEYEGTRDLITGAILDKSSAKNGNGTYSSSLYSKYIMNFDGQTEINIPIYAGKINAALIGRALQASPLRECAQREYQSQSEFFAASLGQAAMPLSSACKASAK